MIPALCGVYLAAVAAGILVRLWFPTEARVMSPNLWAIAMKFSWSRVYIDGDMSGARRAVWIEKTSTILISPAMGKLLGVGGKDVPTAGELLKSKANRRLMLRIYCVRLKRKRRREDLAGCFQAEAK